jgi:hypothetical protein
MGERIEDVKVNFEKTQATMKAKFQEVDPVTQMDNDDNEQLKECGDARVMIQKGTITSPDGETVVPTDLTFIRTRNKRGGIDVTCVVPSLGMSSPT